MEKNYTYSMIGASFPEFSLPAVGRGGAEEVVSSADLLGQWWVLFAWPRDFTFVCPTEIIGFAQLESQFTATGCKILGMSTDSTFVHAAWRSSRSDLDTSFLWIADQCHELSKELGILREDGACERATFIVDPNGAVRSFTVNDVKVGRSPSETLRVLQALQSDELCGCSWNPGDSYIKVSL